MANIKTTFDPKSLVVANVLNAGESIEYDWYVDEMYQIVVTKGTVTVSKDTVYSGEGGLTEINLSGVETVHSAISVVDILPGTPLSVVATTDASFIILLRSDNQSMIEQIMPADGTNYYEFMRDFRPSWYANGEPDVPPNTISMGTGNVVVTSSDMKTMILEGWE